MKSVEQLVVSPPKREEKVEQRLTTLFVTQKSRRHRDASSEYDVEALLRQEITIAVKRGRP